MAGRRLQYQFDDATSVPAFVHFVVNTCLLPQLSCFIHNKGWARAGLPEKQWDLVGL
jgi:hypothetical protein